MIRGERKLTNKKKLVGRVERKRATKQSGEITFKQLFDEMLEETGMTFEEHLEKRLPEVQRETAMESIREAFGVLSRKDREELLSNVKKMDNVTQEQIRKLEELDKKLDLENIDFD